MEIGEGVFLDSFVLAVCLQFQDMKSDGNWLVCHKLQLGTQFTQVITMMITCYVDRTSKKGLSHRMSVPNKTKGIGYHIPSPKIKVGSTDLFKGNP